LEKRACADPGPNERERESNAMIAIRTDRSPNRPNQPPSKTDACLATFTADAFQSSQLPTPPASKPDVTPRSPSRSEGSGKSSWLGPWFLIAVIGGLFRAATSSNFHDAQREAHRQAMSHSAESIDRILGSMRNLPPWQQALTKINECKFVIMTDPKNAEAYNFRAWILATFPDARIRDGKKAVDDATVACTLTEWKQARYLDTLAAAYAESSDFANAARWQEKATALAAVTDKAACQNRLAFYRSHRPYREELQDMRSPAARTRGLGAPTPARPQSIRPLPAVRTGSSYSGSPG
jgi:hypothetical protein